MDAPPPKTLVLEPIEWRALTMLSLQALQSAFDQVAGLSDDGAAQAQVFLDRSRQMIEAWRRASRMADARAVAMESPPPAPEPPVNGAGPVKVNITVDPPKPPNRHERRRNKRRDLSQTN